MCAYGHRNSVKIFPQGVQQVGHRIVTQRGVGAGAVGGKRGKIEGFSMASARRLRMYLMTHSRPECYVYNVSLTLPGEYDADLWRSMVHRLRSDALRACVSYVWRIELQKRKVPHMHLIAWVPAGSKAHRIFTENWIEYLPIDRQKMKGVAKYCVDCKPTEDSNIGWYAYLVAHACKKKAEQLGWKGKQWGIVGQKFLLRINPERYDLDYNQRMYFQRTLRKLIVKSGNHCKTFPQHAGYSRIIDTARVVPLLNWILIHIGRKANEDTRH